MRKLILGATILTFLALPAFAQKTRNGIQPDSSVVCQSTFSSGTGLTYLGFCVSANGNIVSITSPVGYTHLSNREGYSVCDATNGGKLYYDYALWGDNAQWGPSIITQPGGTNTFPLTIQRTTIDGLFTLTQAFSRNAPENSVIITMTLKNNDTVNAHNVYLTRAADADIDNGSWDYQSYFSLNNQSVFAWGTGVSGPDPYGLMLYTETPAIVHSTAFNSYSYGMQTNACDIVQYSGNWLDGIFYLTHQFTLAKNASKIVKVEYKRF